MKVSVLHDQNGTIIALSQIVDLRAVGSQFTRVEMLPGTGQHLLEVDLRGEHEGKSLLELHNGYRVEIGTSKLIKKF